MIIWKHKQTGKLFTISHIFMWLFAGRMSGPTGYFAYEYQPTLEPDRQGYGPSVQVGERSSEVFDEYDPVGVV